MSVTETRDGSVKVVTGNKGHRWVIVAVALGCLGGAGRPARAEGSALEPVRSVIARFAAEFARFAADRRLPDVAVGQVTAPAVYRVNASAGLEALMIEELGKAGVKVSRTSETEIKGEYWLDRDAGDRPESLGLHLRVVRTTGGGPALREFSSRLSLTELDPYALRSLVAVACGLDLQTPVNTLLTVRDAQRELREAEEKVRKPEAESEPDDADETPEPLATIETEFIGNYGVRLEVKNGTDAYMARPMTREGPFLFVDLGPDESFRVVLVNETDDEAAAELTMDGINVLEFSKDAKRRFLVAPKGSLPLEGWISSGDTRMHEFKVKQFGESAFSELGRANHGDLGLITVRLAKCFQSRPKGGQSAELPSHAIGRGAEKAVKVESHPRWIDPGDAVIHVRYRVTRPADPAPELPAGGVARRIPSN